jgi:hypothetical protein
VQLLLQLTNYLLVAVNAVALGSLVAFDLDDLALNHFQIARRHIGSGGGRGSEYYEFNQGQKKACDSAGA